MAEGSQYAKSARCACGGAGVHLVNLGLAGSIWRCAKCHALALGGGPRSGRVCEVCNKPSDFVAAVEGGGFRYYCFDHARALFPVPGGVRPAVESPRLDELQAAADHVLFVARKRIGLLEQQVQLLTAERVRLAAEVEAYRRRDQAPTEKKYGVPNGE